MKIYLLYLSFIFQILTLPLDMLSTENIASDIFQGCFVVTCTLFAFIGLIWLREQILHGGGPDWLEGEDPVPPPPPPALPILENNNVNEPAELEVIFTVI